MAGDRLEAGLSNAGWKPAYVGPPFQAAGALASSRHGVAASRAATLVRSRKGKFSRERCRLEASSPAGSEAGAPAAWKGGPTWGGFQPVRQPLSDGM